MHITPSTTEVIKVRDVSFSYGEKRILDHVSFVVHEGDFLAIVGPNGGGKTTLLKVLLGLLEETAGEVTLSSGGLHDDSGPRKHIGYISQKATSFDQQFPATVKEVVEMAMWRPQLHRSVQALDAIKRVGMEAQTNSLIGELSGGQQQRVFVARALAQNPSLLLLDEPTVGMDKHSEDKFYELIHSLNRADKKTIILVTHNLDKVQHSVTHVLCIDEKVKYFGSSADFIASPLAHDYGHDIAHHDKS